MKQKEIYNGLTTRRFQVESSPIMAESKAKLKIKTQVNSQGSEWEVEDNAGELTTTISSEVF